MEYIKNIMLGNDTHELKAHGNNSRKYFFIHDSYGFGYTPGETTPEVGWYHWVCQYLGLTNGVDAFHVGYAVIPGGYGMAPTVGAAHASWADVIRQMDKSNIPLNEISDVVIFGGTNDYEYINSISAGMADLNSVIRSTFPNARVLLGVYAMTLPITNFGSFKSGTLGVFEAYRRCTQYGWAFASNTVWCLHKRSYMSRDNIHPTRAAYKESSYYLAQAIMTGDCDVDWYSYHNVLPASNLTVVNSGAFHFRFKNGVWSIQQVGTTSGYMDNITVFAVKAGSPSGHYQVAAIPDFCIPPSVSDPNASFPIISTGIYNANIRYSTLQIRDNQIQLNIRADSLNNNATFLGGACSGIGWLF